MTSLAEGCHLNDCLSKYQEEFIQWRRKASAMWVRHAKARGTLQHLRAALWEAACFAATYALLCCIILVKLTKSNSFKRTIQNTGALKWGFGCRTAFLIKAVSQEASLLTEWLQSGICSSKTSLKLWNTFGEKKPQCFWGKKRWQIHFGCPRAPTRGRAGLQGGQPPHPNLLLEKLILLLSLTDPARQPLTWQLLNLSFQIQLEILIQSYMPDVKDVCHTFNFSICMLARTSMTYFYK